MRSFITTLTLVFALGGAAVLADNDGQPPLNIDRMLTAIGFLFLAVFVLLPLYSAAVRLWLSDRVTPVGLRAFNLPNGSIRAMLGLLIVGAFVIVLAHGLSFPANSSAYFSQIITAFGTLAGSVTGFYFGSRGSVAPKGDRTGAAARTTTDTAATAAGVGTVIHTVSDG